MIKMMSWYVLIEELPREEKTSGGLFIPETAKEATQQAIVVEVGPGKRKKNNNELIPTEIKKGDKILFDPLRTYPVTLKGKDYLMVRSEQVLGIVEGP